MSMAQENLAEKKLTFITAPDRLAFLCSVITCVEQLQKNFVLKMNNEIHINARINMWYT